MKLARLAQGEAWMTKGEKERTRKFVRDVERLLRERGVAENLLLALRVDDLVVSWLLARRIEGGLALEPEDGAAATPAITSAQADAIGKNRERLRKSVKDLEDYCARAGTPIDTGLADAMKPVIRQVQGGRPFFEEKGPKGRQ